MPLSRRDGAIVARHEVPGKTPLEDPSRRVRWIRNTSSFAEKLPEFFKVLRFLHLTPELDKCLYRSFLASLEKPGSLYPRPRGRKPCFAFSN
jgi:hypothetical protein